MLLLFVRFQIAAIVILFIICLDFIKNTRLSVLSTKTFGLILVLLSLNLTFDFVSADSLWHFKYIPIEVINTLHRLFFVSFDILILILYFYVCILCRAKFAGRIIRITLASVPAVIAIIVTFCTPIYYYTGESYLYSYGMPLVAMYSCAVFYLSAINIRLVISKGNIDKKMGSSIQIASVIWAFSATVQAFYPGVLILGFANSIMILYIYLSFENPKNYMDLETDSFSNAALRALLTEDMLINKKIAVVAVAVDNLSNITKKLGYVKVIEVITRISEDITESFNLPVFRFRENTLVMVAPSSIGDFRNLSEMMLAKLAHRNYLEEYNVSLDIHIDIIDCNKYITDVDSVYEMLDFMNEIDDDDKIRVLDDRYLSKKLRYENIEKLIAEAIINDGFDVYYQPIYSTGSKKIVSAEALIRLKSTEGLGNVSPEEFIPIAERKCYIMDIGDIILEKVFKFYAENNLKKEGIEYLEVNLSAIQASDSGIADKLEAMRAKYKIKPEYINFEITETAATESGEILNENIARLKELGYSFSMDDFGTGYANLMQIIEVEYDFLKIDKSIVWAYFQEDDKKKKSEAIFSSVVNMAKKLGLRIVAEGVETKQQADILEKLGIDCLQGYYLSVPMPEAEFVRFLKKYNKDGSPH